MNCENAFNRSGHHEPGRKGHAVTPGKRKRSAREKSVESGEVTLDMVVHIVVRMLQL